MSDQVDKVDEALTLIDRAEEQIESAVETLAERNRWQSDRIKELAGAVAEANERLTSRETALQLARSGLRALYINLDGSVRNAAPTAGISGAPLAVVSYHEIGPITAEAITHAWFISTPPQRRRQYRLLTIVGQLAVYAEI